MRGASHTQLVSGLIAAYRELIPAESRIAEELAKRGARIGTSIVDQWPTLSDFLQMYGNGLQPGGALVLGGGPDAASRATGVPFTGATRARDLLGLSSRGEGASRSEAAFWGAVAAASRDNNDAPIESLFGTVHLAHARPFDVEATHEVKDASARHVLRLLAQVRPQVTVAVGTESVFLLARALGDNRLLDIASIDESSWTRLWPAGTRVSQFPYVDVPLARPFRTRLVPVPMLDGPQADEASESLAGVFSYVWAA